MALRDNTEGYTPASSTEEVTWAKIQSLIQKATVVGERVSAPSSGLESMGSPATVEAAIAAIATELEGRVLKFGTTAELLALSSGAAQLLPTGVLIQTAGRDIAGSGGGGTFRLRANAGGETDNLGTVRLLADGRVIEVLERNGDVLLFGPAGDGVTNDTAAIQAALTSGEKRIRIPKDKTFLCNTLTIANAGVTFEIDGTILSADGEATVLTVTGENVTVCGKGVIESPDDVFDGTNSRPTYAVIWITGNGVSIKDVTLQTVPRVGIHFEDATQASVEFVKIYGGFPYADYSSPVTGHKGISYNPPASGSDSAEKESFQLVGCHIEECIQGVAAGNYDLGSERVGLSIRGNTFWRCWDHAIYTESFGGTVSDNNMYDCKAPIAMSVVRNTVIAGNTSRSITSAAAWNNSQHWSMRDAINCTISNNIIEGKGAALGIDSVVSGSLGGTVANNLVSNNVIHRTEDGVSASLLRLGLDADSVYNNKIIGNIITGVGAPALNGTVHILARSGAVGQGNEFTNNTIDVESLGYALYVVRQAAMRITGNRIQNKVDADSSETTALLGYLSCANTIVENNSFEWLEGGTNVTLYGTYNFSGNSGSKIRHNKFRLSSGDLVATTPINNPESGSIIESNIYADDEGLSGSFTWPIAVTELTVSNANIRSSTTSQVLVVPKTPAAGALVGTQGFYVEVGSGEFTIHTGDGNNTASSSGWAYFII